MYQAKYFKAYELVPPSLYALRKEKAIQLLDKELLVALDYIREKLGRKITVNNWFWGGTFSQRGIRTPDAPEYSVTSQHPYGKAVDFDVEGMTAEQVNAWIIQHRNDPELVPISFIEMGKSWTHIDTRPVEDNLLICWWTDGSTAIHSREV